LNLFLTDYPASGRAVFYIIFKVVPYLALTCYFRESHEVNFTLRKSTISLDILLSVFYLSALFDKFIGKGYGPYPLYQFYTTKFNAVYNDGKSAFAINH